MEVRRNFPSGFGYSPSSRSSNFVNVHRDILPGYRPTASIFSDQTSGEKPPAAGVEDSGVQKWRNISEIIAMEVRQDSCSNFAPRCCPKPSRFADQFSGEKRPAAGVEGSGVQSWRRKVSCTKSKPSIGQEKLKKTIPVPVMASVSCESNNGGEREKVIEKLRIFRSKCKELLNEPVTLNCRKTHRIDYRAKKELLREGKIGGNPNKIIGPIPGVEIGDEFNYRVELTIVGLHSRFEHGIDYMEIGGRSLATCVVATEGYSDKMQDSDQVLTYIGEGGIHGSKKGQEQKDQKLTYGNLALKNSIVAKNYVRVVRGFKFGTRSKTTYIYDGLYRVTSFEEKIGLFRNRIFEFKLTRCPGQPTIRSRKFNHASK